jgi:hypothetical protein
MPSIRFVLRLLLLLAIIPAAAFASVTTGVIKGTTVDGGGLPIPGVSVTIVSDNMMGQKELTTGADGRFLFIELPPGKYTLTARADGFTSVQKPNMQVSIGRNTIITVTMPLLGEGGQEMEGGEEMIIEETRSVIDTESGNRGSVLTKEFLERIPAGRSYQSAVQMAAGVTGGANANVAGSAYNENTYLLDGVNITDPVTGTFSLNFNFDAIEQIEVLTSAFDPEYGVNLGGSINVVTETGGNTFETKTGIYITNGNWSPKLDGRYAADGMELAPTDFDSRWERYEVGMKVSGPIVRDKAWIVTAYQMTRTLIANAGVELPRDFDAHYLITKLTFQPTSDHRITAFLQSDPTTIDNVYYGDRFIKPEAQGRQAQGGYVTSLQWDWFISPESFLETKALIQKSFIERYGVPCTHDQDIGYHPCETDETENYIDFVTPGRLGQNLAYDSGNEYYFDFDDRWRGSIQSKYSLLQLDFLGTHDLKAGFNAELLRWKRTVGYTGNIYYVDLNTLAYNPDTLRNYYWIEASGPLSYAADAESLGLFIQDVYKPIENLTFRYGVRYDRQIFRNDVGEPVTNTGLWGPRFSAIWDPWANAKTKIVGSIGRFNDTSRLGVANYLSQSDFGSKLFLGEAFNEFTSNAGNDYSYSPIENTNQILPNTTAPRADMFTVGVEREVIQDLALSAYFTGKFTRNLYAFDELNFVWDQDGYNRLATVDGTANTYYRLRTPDVAQRDYYRSDLSILKIFSNRWEAQGSYSFTRSRGTTQTSPSSFLAVPGQLEYYLDGNLGTDITHDVSAGFAWQLPDDPWTTELGGTIFMESGYPLSRYYDSAFGSILKDTVGTYTRSQTWWKLSLLVKQSIPVRKGALKGYLQVDNATNNRAGQSAYFSQDNRWIISGRTDPTQLMVGAEYEF